MVSKRTIIAMLTVLAALGATNSFALWGQAKTKTTQGNADMGLGEYAGLKHAIGCTEFENEAGWHGNWEIGKNLTVMLESALYDTGRFVVVEREKLTSIVAEQDLAASGRTAKAKDVAQTGKLRSARYLATGAVTEVDDGQSGGNAGISVKGFRIGGRKNETQVTIILKLIDTTTGQLVAKERIVGKAGGTGLDVGLNVGGISTDMGGFKKTPLGQAAQDCINQAAALVAKQMEEFPFEGSVIKSTGTGSVIINRGSEFGVEVGQNLVIATEGEELIDPSSGEILGKEEGEIIGKLTVTKTQEKISYCDVTEGDKAPPPGAVVKAVE
ncbi:MAG: hypothetical protein O3B24_02505 [Verrucomicrobia bacterium]|nr:hypothetical protein [Verrucomicrobiota bacterium]